MMLRSLSARIVLGALAVVTVVLFAGGLTIVKLTEARDRRDADADLARFARNLTPAIAATLGLAPLSSNAQALSRLAVFNRSGARMRLPGAPRGTDGPALRPVASQSLIIAFNQRGGNSGPAGQIEFLRAMDPRNDRRLVLGNVPIGFPAMSPEAGARTVDLAGTSYRDEVVHTPVRVVVEVVALGKSIDARSASVRTVVIWAGLVGLLGALLGVLVTSRMALRPLSALTRKAAAVKGTGDLDVRVQEPGQPREVADLAGELDRMLARLQDAVGAREASLQAARRFAADVGHELRTPLQSVRANLDIAKSDGANDEQRQVALQTATLQTERLNRLVDGLQTLARGESGLVSPAGEVDLGDIADSAVFAAKTRHPDLVFDTKLPRSGPTVRGDADGLWRAVENLLENAARHGGTSGHVRLQVSATGDAAEVVVEDDGPGIAQSERDRVVRPFARGAGATGPGSGLGLAIVAAEARRHGGELTLSDSELGGLLARVTLQRYGGS